MEIRNIRHKGLKAFVERGVAKGLPAPYVDKIGDIITYLLEMNTIDDVFALEKYRPHRLKGDRLGTISVSITPNWRITFGHDRETNEIVDLDFQDYH